MKKKILVIEDDYDIRAIIKYVLEDEGYQIISPDPGTSKTYHRYKADLILLDEWVNKKEGHKLCLELKEIPETGNIPVIILSTQASIEKIAKSCRADGYLKKPFDLDDLIYEVKKCLKPGDLSKMPVIR